MLNNTLIKNLKPKEKLYRKTDTNGLVLEVKPSGVKAWRYRYRYPAGTKEKMLSLGNYPEVSLLDARKLRDDARRLLDQGLNPKDHLFERVAMTEKDEPAGKKFIEVYLEWYAMNDPDWSAAYAMDLNQSCMNHLVAYIGETEIDEITSMDMLDVFKRIEARNTLNMLKKVRGYASRVFRYGVGMGYCKHDPVRDLPSDVFKKENPQNYAHTTDPKTLGFILAAMQTYDGYYSVKKALQVMPHVFLRPNQEFLQLRWEYFLWDDDLIEIPSHVMKKSREHLVPMSRQVKAIFKEMYDSRRLDMDWVFASSFADKAHISDTALRNALKSVGVTNTMQVPHGFRHTASTLLNEQGWPGDVVERQLAHVDKNKVRGTYNKALYLDIRREMMQAWSDYLDSLLASHAG